jgi:hypothetical protein
MPVTYFQRSVVDLEPLPWESMLFMAAGEGINFNERIVKK